MFAVLAVFFVLIISLVAEGGRKLSNLSQAEAIVSYVPDAVLERFVITGDSVFVSVRVSADSYLPGLDIDGVGSHRARVFDPFG